MNNKISPLFDNVIIPFIFIIKNKKDNFIKKFKFLMRNWIIGGEINAKHGNHHAMMITSLSLMGARFKTGMGKSECDESGNTDEYSEATLDLKH